MSAGTMRCRDEDYLMYLFHSKLLFIPELWTEGEEGRKEGERMEARVRKAETSARRHAESETEGDREGHRAQRSDGGGHAGVPAGYLMGLVPAVLVPGPQPGPVVQQGLAAGGVAPGQHGVVQGGQATAVFVVWRRSEGQEGLAKDHRGRGQSHLWMKVERSEVLLLTVGRMKVT